jgi:phospholipase/carboxylesterase
VELTHAVRAARSDPQGAIVLLHGRGTDEYDLAPLIDELDPERRLVGITPRGPLTLPPGGAHWYVAQRVGFPEPESFLASLALLGAFLDGLPDTFGVPVDRTLLGGFSQGAVMAYALSFGRGRRRPAAMLGLSGFVPTVPGFELDLDGLAGYPVALGHGSYDPVIDVSFGRAARDLLVEAGADVTWRESPMAHSVDPAYLDDLAEWLERALRPPG